VNDPDGPAEQTSAPDDGRLLARLGEMLRAADPPPADALELARQSFGLRTIEAELARLVEDSETAMAESAAPSRAMAVRGAGLAAEPRQLTFHFDGGPDGAELIIAIQVESSAGRLRITGHLTPQESARIEVRQPAAPQVRAIDVDRLGRFVIDDVPAGPTRLTCRRAEVPDVATEWTLL
jgi:hypothetical protein